MTIGFIGAGNMGGAILRGLKSSPAHKGTRFLVSQPHGEASYWDNPRLVRESDVILICVKPFLIKNVLHEISPEAVPAKLFISIAAGVSTACIEALLGFVPVVRAMPNMPASLGWGMSALCGGAHSNAQHLAFSQAVFDALGKTILLDERQMDMATALSGSGPAFFYFLLDAFAETASQSGIDKNQALLMAAQTAAGAAQVLLHSGENPHSLIQGVATPGGTTAAGLEVLQRLGAAEIIAQALKAAEARSKELGS